MAEVPSALTESDYCMKLPLPAIVPQRITKEIPANIRNAIEARAPQVVLTFLRCRKVIKLETGVPNISTAWRYSIYINYLG